MDINNINIAQNNYNLYKSLEKMIKKAGKREIIFLCVGNPKIWFDSFGPIVGSVLKHLKIEKLFMGIHCLI